MNIVFFTHPEFFPSLSMIRFASLLSSGMKAKGHTVSLWSPEANAIDIPIPLLNKKWLGYIDQYVIFPGEIKKKIKKCPLDTLFVFTDNALGPWLPLVADRPHVMHCHDFLALRSALGEEVENPTSATGQQYQKFIQRGYQKGKHFISDSDKTREDLHRFIANTPTTSDRVYVGLNPLFRPFDPYAARNVLSKLTRLDLSGGYLLHVGGNQWYKNRLGVMDLYDALCEHHANQLPLLMIGPKPGEHLLTRCKSSPFQNTIHFLSDVTDENVCMAYAGASLFLFPSLAEGFGWPIVEAMASGCLVVTTNEAPMTEVAGEAAIFIDRQPNTKSEAIDWAAESAIIINEALSWTSGQRSRWVERGIQNTNRFKLDSYLDRIEKIYQAVLNKYT